jgi:hypothetical protein
MCGIAEDNCARAVVVRRAFDVYKGQMRVMGELTDEFVRINMLWRDAWEICIEKCR